MDYDEAPLIEAAFDWLTDDRDPSTRDLLSLEGLKVADWIDTSEERRRIVREIVGAYRDGDVFIQAHGLIDS